ncbi:MAG: acyl-CoA thioesterase [Nannocystaceae bacterium]
MSASAAAVSCEFEVPFHDVDALKIVWHGHYYKYLELGRTALMRSRDLDVPAIADFGLRMVVIESKCRYTYPLHYANRVRVSAWFTAVSPRIVIAYRLHNLSENRCAARGQTTLVTTDPDGRLLLETPDALLARLP